MVPPELQIGQVEDGKAGGHGCYLGGQTDFPFPRPLAQCRLLWEQLGAFC
jgi:hypothetical protein